MFQTPPSTQPTAAGHVLAITGDAVLADDVRRLGAAVGIAVTVAADALRAAPNWQGADLVLIDEDALAGVRALGLPQRSRAVLLAQVPVAAQVWRDSLTVGVTAVVSLPAGEQWLVAAMAEAASRESSLAPVAVVLGSRGGVGASMLAVALAWVAADEGLSSYLLDLDPLGAGVQVMLGADQLPGSGWTDVSNTAGRVPPRALRAGLPTIAGVRIMGWPQKSDAAGADESVSHQIPAGVTAAVIDAAARDGDVVIVDLPRWSILGAGQPAPCAMEALTRADLIVLVAAADVRSALAGRRLMSIGGLSGLPVGLVVRGPSPGGITADDVAAALELSLLAFLPHERGLDRLVEDGFPPGSRRKSSLRSVAVKLLTRLADSRHQGGS